MTGPRHLSEDDFSIIVRLTPLVSIDLIIRDANGNVLVGLRRNEPAKGWFFVPGGVIRKNERIAAAFARILQTETGCRAAVEDARLLGVYEHHYRANRFGDPSFGTHYVVIGYELRFGHRPLIVPDAQHSALRWMDENELLDAADVHDNTKAYFR